MPDEQQDPSSLKVPSEAVVIRLISPKKFDFDDNEILPSALNSSEFKPRASDNGPSFYVQDRLGPSLEKSVEKLEAENGRWSDFGYVALRASELESLGFKLHFTPDDCPYDAVKDAHASIVNDFNRKKRDEALDKFKVHLKRKPEQPEQ